MSLPLKSKIAFACVIASLLTVMATPGQAASGGKETGISPALCGPGDIAEPGIQGAVPAGQTANYNCGVKLVGQLARVGNVQGAGQCAYVRSGGNVFVIDMSDPA